MSGRALSSFVRAAVLLFNALLLHSGAVRAASDPAGVGRFPPVMASRAAPLRQALILAPELELDGASRTPVEDYRDLLRLLGFDVTIVPAMPRPTLMLALRRFADEVQPEADVAVLLLGSVVPNGQALYLLPPGAAAAASSPDKVPFEGVSITELLRRIAARNHRDVVAIADGCYRDRQDRDCSAALADMPAGVSVLVSAGEGQAAPALARDLLPLMRQEGLAFADLGAALGKARPIVQTYVLSRRFAFVPPGFFEGLPLACNNVDLQVSAERLRTGPALQPLIAACADAAAHYPLTSYFKARLAAANEQSAARDVLTSCGAAASAYLNAYPEGRYREAVAAARQTCKQPVVPPPPPKPAANPLQQRARAAVDDYFRRRNYEQGDNFGALVRLYPPQFRSGRSTVSSRDYLHSLGAWYGDYDSVVFEVASGSPDLSACTRDDSCLVRGTVRVRTLKSGESQYAWSEDRFVLRLDLSSGQVLMECGVAGPNPAPDSDCD